MMMGRKAVAMSRAGSTSVEQLATVRDTVESIWVAIVLAFVLRAFVLEAFVIPTGSMAPRLMGKHWQFDCPACGYHYAFGIPHKPGLAVDISRPLGGAPSVCPNCQRRNEFGKAWAYGGDRVLVLKYLYRFREPKAWDVVVFKNPQDNTENYIKRLVGRPGQQIELIHGDVFYRDGKDFNGDAVIDEKDFGHPRAAAECPWRILRKSAKTQSVMWQVIQDHDYRPAEGTYDPEDVEMPAGKWTPVGGDGWVLNGQGGRVFAYTGAGQRAELRFQAPREQFCPNYAYNLAGKGMYDKRTDVSSDLKLSLVFVPKSSKARVGLHLSSFDDHFRAWVGADGKCVIEHGRADKDGQVVFTQKNWPFGLIKPLALGRGHEVALMHADHQVILRVNDQEIRTTDAQYHGTREAIVAAVAAGVPVPTVGIAAEGGPAELWHIRLMRDVYYTNASRFGEYGRETIGKGWATTGHPMVLRKFLTDPDSDEFFVLGDNSPASKDSRMWDYHAPTLRKGYRMGTVPRYNLIGKAFFVYWPGGYRLPLLKRLPIIPNVGRMRLIR